MKESILRAWKERGSREKLAIISDIASIAGVSLLALLSPLLANITPSSIGKYASFVGAIALFTALLVMLFTVVYLAFRVVDHFLANENDLGLLKTLLKLVVTLIGIVVGAQVFVIGFHVANDSLR